MAETSSSATGGANPFNELVRLAVAAQERSLQVAQRWSDSLLETVKTQSEDTRANLATLSDSLAAMERALESQEETNRAMRQSLEGYRAIVERLTAAQERNATLVRTAVDDLKAATQGQLEAARSMMTPPSAVTATTEPFTEMLQAWNNAFRQFMSVATPSSGASGRGQSGGRGGA